MSIVRSPELGGLTDRKVRAAMFYSKKRRLERKRVGGLITGTPPVLSALTNGNLLTNSITWSIPDNDGQDSIARQMRLNSGPWITFDIGRSVLTGEFWTVREYIQSAGNTKLFTSNAQEVTA